MLKNHRAEWMLVAVTVLAALGWIFSKEALAEMPPWYFLGSRFLLAGFILFLLGRKHWHRLRELSPVLTCVKFGLLMTAVMILWVMGLHHTSHVGEGAFITSLGVILVPFAAGVLFRERLSVSIVVALVVAVCGLLLLSIKDGIGFERSQVYFLLSAILIAIHFAYVSHRAPKFPTILFGAIQLSVVGIMGLLVSAFSEAWPNSLSSNLWAWFLASVLLATCLRFMLQMSAQSYIPANAAALIMILEPVWAALLAVLWFSEAMTLAQVFGCLLIFSALLISRWRWIRNLLR